MTRRILFASLVALAIATAAIAQTPAAKPAAQAPAAKAAPPPGSMTKSAVQTETATIVAIDTTKRLVSLKAEDGAVATIAAGPDIQRFNDLKVGDKVTFKYYESVVYAIQKPGDAPPSPDKISVERTGGAKPGGTMSETQTTVVTVTSIDMAIPAVSVKTGKGDLMHFKVEDKVNLTGVKVGDKVQVTYTQALAISVEAPKK